uniref:Cyclic nucleotide-binding domain-containing protein n=1 Tax=Globisporangium ultimum (strain ATCC 200006 / CBS 805.95 / DAOM BR144) TaxID=431595 RepID=K3WDZ0_GLOUD
MLKLRDDEAVETSKYSTNATKGKVPYFSTQPKAFMKTVLMMVESDFLSPNQTVIGVYDLEELIIVGRGEIRVLDVEQKQIVQLIENGQWYAEHALFQDQMSTYELVAGTFCEVYCLSRQNFQSAMEKHFPKLKIASMQVQYVRQLQLTPSDTASPAIRPTDPRRAEPASRRITYMGSISKKSHLADATTAIPWRFPNSSFRTQWRRWKAALLIFLSIQVPFEIAFDWRTGVLSSDGSMRQTAVYLMSLGVEIFSYADVYLRAREFVRSKKRLDSTISQNLPVLAAQSTTNSNMKRRSQERLYHGLVVKSDITEHYLNHGDVVFDFAATLPISMVWNFVSKDTINFETMYYMSFFRLLALV